MKSLDIKIRQAVPEDAGEIQQIYSYYVQNTAITYEITVPDVTEMKERIAGTLEKYPYIVAEIDGKIAGYAYASPFKTREAYQWSIETSIYVDKALKGRGIGRKMLTELEKRLKDQGILNSNACIAKAEIEDEYLKNDSIKFHEKMGYQMVGEFHKCAKKFGRWYNMVWMEKHLGKHE